MELIVTYYNEDLGWLDRCPSDVDITIYDKSGRLTEKSLNRACTIKIVENNGGNQGDILRYIVLNYETIQNAVGFCQGSPFDHCEESFFLGMLRDGLCGPLDELQQGDIPNPAWRRSEEIDGGFCEINNSWYIFHLNRIFGSRFKGYACSVPSFDSFMSSLFSNYYPLRFIRFAPGSQYIVSKSHVMKYPIEFWQFLLDFLPKRQGLNGGVEAHILERALFHLFYGNLSLRNGWQQSIQETLESEPRYANSRLMSELYRWKLN